MGYGDGAYFIVALSEDTTVWGSARQDFADIVVDVDTIQISAPANDNNAYGVICRQQPNGDGYTLRISGDGFYSIHRILEGEFEALVEWSTSDVIRQGNDTNHVRAICNGPRLALIVNGEELAQATDATFRSGDLALTATTFESEPTEIHFDDLMVSAPGDVQPSPEVLFRDDFEDAASGWDVWESDAGAEAGYGPGRYRILATGGRWMWGASNHHFTNVVIEVETTQVSAPANDNNGYGVICRVQPNEWGDGYALVISGDQHYSIQKIVQGEWEPLIDWTRSNVIHPGDATNAVRAVCDGDRLVLVVNGQVLGQTEDSTYSSGDVSLVATSFEAEEPTEIHFDDLVITRPSR
jgi:hypothetical protein